MTACTSCSRELQPAWKYCISCGTRTGVPATAALEVVPPEESRHYSATSPSATSVAGAGVLRVEGIPADDQSSPEPTPATHQTGERFNVLAVLALVLGCLVSPLAALFGHLALSQIARSGERGTALAWAATVLGYLSLAAWLVLGISYLALHH